ncbi:MAG: sulfotransferase family protein [Cyanobacteria bacterium M_surface_10_m2_179]|nr:sulfotransferase family protein [Cyanobacteria bacterium K_DeepCast_35m_m2_023]MBM5806459.1 sulfotransferase family protein [Cyanobacteria bacterium M_surface_10_m2_179]
MNPQVGRKDRVAAAVLAWSTGRQPVHAAAVRNLLIYPQAGLAYNRIKKSGNSSMLLYLRDALAPGSPQASQPYNRAKDEAIALGCTMRQLLRRPRALLRLPQCFFFTVMRDPRARLLSGFLEKVGSGHAQRYSAAGGFGDASPQGFERFLTYLEEGGLHDDAHWWPQVDLMAFAPDQFDAIYQLESIDQHLPALLRQRGLTVDGLDCSRPHRVEQQFTVPGKPFKLKQAASKLQHYLAPGVEERIVRLYEPDFYAGGYAPGVIG